MTEQIPKYYCCADIKDMTLDQARDCRYYYEGICHHSFRDDRGICSVIAAAEEEAEEKGQKLPRYSRELPPLTLGS